MGQDTTQIGVECTITYTEDAPPQRGIIGNLYWNITFFSNKTINAIALNFTGIKGLDIGRGYRVGPKNRSDLTQNVSDERRDVPKILTRYRLSPT